MTELLRVGKIACSFFFALKSEKSEFPKFLCGKIIFFNKKLVILWCEIII